MHAVVDPGDPARRSEHHPFVVELGGDQPPAGVLLADEHVDRNPDIVVVGGVRVVRTSDRMIGVQE